MTVTLSELPFLTASLAILSQASWNLADTGSFGTSSDPGNAETQKHIFDVLIFELHIPTKPYSISSENYFEDCLSNYRILRHPGPAHTN